MFGLQPPGDVDDILSLLNLRRYSATVEFAGLCCDIIYLIMIFNCHSLTEAQFVNYDNFHCIAQLKQQNGTCVTAIVGILEV